jgi:periplasmic protein CpxP/Spy
MIRRAAIIATSALFVVLGSAAVIRATSQNHAQPEPFAEELLAQNPQPMRRGMGWLRELNLSQDQMQRIQEIRNRHRDQLKNDRDAVRRSQQELRDLLAGTASDDQIRAKHQQVRDLRNKLSEAQFNSMLEIRNVLTPEQRRKFAERMERQRPRFRERMRDRDNS